jgi:Flp pilus assembly protein TadG
MLAVGLKSRIRPNRPDSLLFPGSRLLRGLGGCRRGTAAVEFVLVSGPLLLLLFGFVATNAMFYTWSIMQNNVQYAAMLLSTNTVSSFSASGVTCSSSLGTSQVEYYACSGLPNWATFSATVAETCGAIPTVQVTLSANASSAALADIYSLFTGKTLSAQSSTMKQGNCP